MAGSNPASSEDESDVERYLAVEPLPEAEAASTHGTLGVLTGNWGGKRTSRALQRHIYSDIRQSAAQLILLQEAERELIGVLEAPSVEGSSPDADGPKIRPEARFICVRGHESANSNLIACRKSQCQEIGILLWKKRNEGTWKRTAILVKRQFCQD